MNKLSLIILTFCCSVIFAADPPKPAAAPAQNASTGGASEASVKQLLEAGQARKMVEGTMGQMEGFMKSTMQQMTQGQTLTPKQQKDIDTAQAEAMTMIKEMLDWNKLEPMYIRIYQKSLTQQEVEGMIAFYKTPAGQAVITKMPVIMQHTMTEMQQLMAPMMQKLQKKQQEIAAEIKAGKKGS